jgi:putrescine transport system substrate-binding protein
VLEAKLAAGKSGYDVVFPTAMPFFARGIQAKLYRKLDLSKIPNAKGIDVTVLNRLKTADPDNAFGLPYMTSTTAIGYNNAKIRGLIPDPPIGSLALLYDKKTIDALKPCGVTLLDAPDEEFSAVLAFLGKNPTSMQLADLEDAAKFLKADRPAYRYMHSSRYISDLATGEICVAHGWTGDLFQARKRAREAKNGINIEIFLPKEGVSAPTDVMAIPVDAPHLDEAHAFINYILDPKVIAAITNEVGYANAVPASRPFISPEILDDPVVYPPASIGFYTMALPTARYDRERNRLWTKFKTGN